MKCDSELLCHVLSLHRYKNLPIRTLATSIHKQPTLAFGAHKDTEVDALLEALLSPPSFQLLIVAVDDVPMAKVERQSQQRIHG